MSKLRKKLITVLAVLICALLTLTAAITFLPKSKPAAAADTLNSAISDKFKVLEDDIWTSDAVNGGEFDFDNLKKLYAMLTGKNTATFNDVEKLGVKNSAYFRGLSTSDGKNLSIKFHGYHWTAVGLDRTRSGDVILTLWLTDYSELDSVYQTTQYSKYYFDPSDSKNSSITSGDWWPSNVYSTSLLRTKALNIGGICLKSPTPAQYDKAGATFTYVEQDSNHPLAPFTMGKVVYPDSVTQYLATPAEVKYQEREIAPEGVNNSPNDGYGEYSDADAWSSAVTAVPYSFYKNLKFTGIGNTVEYNSWKDDYLWAPSDSEVGRTASSVEKDIWQMDTTGKTSGYDDATANSWNRSGGSHAGRAREILCAGTGALARGNTNGVETTGERTVRPAMHLNLTKAAFNAGGISFGNDDTTVSTSTDGSKTATAKHTYNGKDYKLEIPDYDKLDVDFSSLPNTAKYDKDSGEFTVKLPNGSDSENYEISVTPKKDYYWGDAKTVEEGKKQRKYAIHVNKATIETDWKDFSVQYGGDLLYKTAPVSKTVKDISVDFEVNYCITHAASGTPQEPSVKNWKSEAELETKTATAMGKYRVDYKIDDYVDGTNHYHSTLYGSYIVTVNSDTVTISVRGDGAVGSAEYGDAVTLLTDQTWLNTQFAKRVTLSGTSGTYDNESAVLEFLDKEGLNVVLLKNGGSGKKSASQNGYDRFDAGIYYLGLEESGSIGFKWDTNGEEKYPSYEITKKEIKVYIVDESGGELSHIYGNSLAALNYDVDTDAQTFLKEIKDKFSHTFTIVDVIDGSMPDDKTLSNKTPVGTYMIEGTVNEDSNFEVNFADTEYAVGKRPVKLQVADKEVKYGTDFNGVKFTLTDADNSLPAWDKASALSAEYYLTKKDGVPVEFGDVAIGEYVLCVRVNNPNYDFTYDFGKLYVIKADFDMAGVKLYNAAYVYDGQAHPAQLSGGLPSNEIKTSYKYVNMADGSSSEEAPVEIGLYTVYASFAHGNPNYNPIADKAAYIRIVASADDLNQDFPSLPSDEEIEAAADLAKKKAEAKKSLDEEAKAKKEAIDSNADMTAEDKKAAKEEIEKELAEGNAAIDNAKDKDSVDKAYDDGKKDMEDTVELAETKTDAKKELGEGAQAKKDAIDADVNLSPEEKKAAKEEIDKQLEEGKKEIDKSTNVNDVEAAESASKKDIEDYTEVVQKKGSAKSELDKAAQAKKEAIDNNPDLTDEEKAAAKAEVDKELAKGKAEIDGATDVGGIQSVESSTKANIENIKPEHKGGFPWWILAVAAGVLILAIVVIIVIKKRQTAAVDEDFYDEDYDFDESDYEEEDFSDDDF